MSSEQKIIYMGRGGTPYIRIPDRIKPEDAYVATVTEAIQDLTQMEAGKDRIASLQARAEAAEARLAAAERLAEANQEFLQSSNAVSFHDLANLGKGPKVQRYINAKRDVRAALTTYHQAAEQAGGQTDESR